MRKLLLVVTAASTIACGSTGSTPAGGAPTAGADAGVAAPTLGDDISISTVSLNQGVKVSLVAGGVATASTTPIVAGRPGLLRLGVTTGANWQPRALDAELHLFAAGKEVAVLKDAGKTPAVASDADLTTTFNFAVTAETITTDVTYSLVLRDPAGAASSISFPADGSTQPLLAKAGGEQIKIQLVPVQYQDPASSGAPLLPDSSPAQVQRFHDTIYKMYPTAKVDVSVRKPMPWNQTISPDGTGWDELLMAIMDLRSTDRAADDVFYVGMFISAPTVGQYCSDGCVLGVAQLADPADIAARMALIAGYGGQLAPNTLNQELAHAMGREHANCGGADSPDPKFPYKNAGIGVWGYDLLKESLIDPKSDVRDFMGYCDPIWISDYTYSALFKRLAFVNLQKREQGAPMKYRAIHVAADGALTWGRTVTLTHEPMGEAHDVSFAGAGGAEVEHAVGHLYRRDNLPGGTLLVKEPRTLPEAVRIGGLGARAFADLHAVVR